MEEKNVSDSPSLVTNISRIAEIKKSIFHIMEESPEGNAAARYFNIFMMVLIIGNVFTVILETSAPIHARFFTIFSIIDIVSISIFTVEYFLRLWICTTNPVYENPVAGRLRYAGTPLALIDLFAFLPFYIPLIIPLDLRFIRVLRLFRIFRLLKLGRYSESMKLFSRVISRAMEQLLLVLTVLFVFLVLSSTFMYYAEHEAQPDKFGSIPDAMWWAIVTLGTVGYGDVYPITLAGKILGAIVITLCIAVFALPAAILSSGFIEESQKTRVIICPACGHRIGGNENDNNHPKDKRSDEGGKP